MAQGEGNLCSNPTSLTCELGACSRQRPPSRGSDANPRERLDRPLLALKWKGICTSSFWPDM